MSTFLTYNLQNEIQFQCLEKEEAVMLLFLDLTLDSDLGDNS